MNSELIKKVVSAAERALSEIDVSGAASVEFPVFVRDGLELHIKATVRQSELRTQPPKLRSVPK